VRLWRRPITVSYGHGVEMAWLVHRALDTLGDGPSSRPPQLLALIDHALRFGFDRERGGLAQYGPPTGSVRRAVYLSRERLTRRWWEQAELLVATLAAYQWTREPRYLAAFAGQFEWVWNHQIDHEGGEWWVATAWPDGRPLEFHKGDAWKGSYHSARALMEISRRLSSLSAS
jgi:mannobiose 2-epimerase